MLPTSQIFNMSLNDTEALTDTATSYVDLLLDMDELVATDSAFGVGGWIAQAKKLAKAQGGADCIAEHFTAEIQNCGHFYEWNARVQITTWDPTPKGAKAPGKETVDYASKHWSGLIKDYYANRVKLTAQQARLDNAQGV
jgi:alpha-N-acetylglucosaminidase